MWSVDYTSGEDFSKGDEANIAFWMISDPTSFEKAVKNPKMETSHR